MISQIIILSVCASFGILLYLFLKKFNAKKHIYLPLFIALLLFAAGFYFRISGEKELVDLGFFFTESSTLFISVMFTTALIMGQERYWKNQNF